MCPPRCLRGCSRPAATGQAEHVAYIPQEDRESEEGYDEREIPGAAVILDGSFNPGIMHPYWFVAYGIISQEEADAAAETVTVGTEHSHFALKELAFRSQRRRLRVASTIGSEDFERVASIVVQTLTVLPHMPVQALSLNRSAHVPLEPARWDSLATRLAPPEHWTEVLEGASMASVTMRVPDGEEAGSLEVLVEASQRVTGAFVSVIKRIEFPADARSLGNERARAAIQKEWAPLTGRAEDIIERIVELA